MVVFMDFCLAFSICSVEHGGTGAADVRVLNGSESALNLQHTPMLKCCSAHAPASLEARSYLYNLSLHG